MREENTHRWHHPRCPAHHLPASVAVAGRFGPNIIPGRWNRQNFKYLISSYFPTHFCPHFFRFSRSCPATPRPLRRRYLREGFCQLISIQTLSQHQRYVREFVKLFVAIWLDGKLNYNCNGMAFCPWNSKEFIYFFLNTKKIRKNSGKNLKFLFFVKIF